MSKKIDIKNELERIELLNSFENKLYDNFGNNILVGGIDEVGRGPFAGPVVAACVILPKDTSILYINDSKKLSEKKRIELDKVIRDKAIDIGIGVVNENVIDEINILQATYKAMRIAISNMKIKPTILLNDAVTIPNIEIKQYPIVKGDTKSISIAAASIIAKVYRDNIMLEMDKLYPEYDFKNNKGYGTVKHRQALNKFGPCKIHRKTFIKKYI